VRCNRWWDAAVQDWNSFEDWNSSEEWPPWTNGTSQHETSILKTLNYVSKIIAIKTVRKFEKTRISRHVSRLMWMMWRLHETCIWQDADCNFGWFKQVEAFH